MEVVDYWTGTDSELEGRWTIHITNKEGAFTETILTGNNDMVELYEQSYFFRFLLETTYTQTRILELQELRENKEKLKKITKTEEKL